MKRHNSLTCPVCKAYVTSDAYVRATAAASENTAAAVQEFAVDPTPEKYRPGPEALKRLRKNFPGQYD